MHDTIKTKERLKDAYECIEFFASTTWQESNSYQQLNQELLSKESAAQDTLFSDAQFPRTVRDVIPDSRLAQYSNYEYNEERESCYVPTSRTFTFYYPCTYKRESIKEPWMLPEIEQFFIWFSYTTHFNVLEQLPLEDLEDPVKTDRNYPPCDYSFPQVHITTEDSLEQTKSKTERDLEICKPVELKVETIDEMIMRIKLRSGSRSSFYIAKSLSVSFVDTIKHLWSSYSQPKVESVMEEKYNIMKSPLGNSFFVDKNRDAERYKPKQLLKSNWILDEHHLKRIDFEQLQYLANAIKTLKLLDFNFTKKTSLSSFSSSTIPYEESDTELKTPIPSTRRLYSAVVQGLDSDHNKPDITNYTELNVHSDKSACPIKHSPEKLSFDQKDDTVCPTSVSSRRINQMSPLQSSKSSTQLNQEQLSTLNRLHTKSSPINLFDSSSKSAYCSDSSVNNITNNACNTAASCNLTNVSEFCLNPYTGNSYSNTSHFSNACSNIYTNSYNYNYKSQHPTNFHGNYSNTGPPYNNNLYATTNNLQQNQIQFNRAFPSNQMYSMWLVPPSRTPPLYSFTHYTSQPYMYLNTPQVQTQQFPPSPSSLPQSQHQNQRWQYPLLYVRTQNPLQSHHMPVSPQYPTVATSQQWGMQSQNVYRVNSKQQVAQNQQISSYMQNRAKIKHKKFGYNTQYKVRSKSPEEFSLTKRQTNYDLQSAEKQYIIKTAASTSSLEYTRLKHHANLKSNKSTRVSKRSSTMAFRTNSENCLSSDSDESHTALPITTALSEDLERQALEQYQNSNENFYQELERQAEEQYDDEDPENLLRPPYPRQYIGGLIILNVLFY
ncbi:hypothetical protein FQA39_LY18248 [Lamprigera yunnana]|nr:hypothetical protein FQA39_LY18248 [Lamprigera yunnana]